MEHWYEAVPVLKIKAWMLIVHGAGEYSERHLNLATYFTRAGYAVGMGDLPGHGRTAGTRGHIDSFQTYVDTVALWAKRMKERFPDVPCFVVGHSMGGLITARYIQQRTDEIPWGGVLLTSPCMGLALPVPHWKRQMALLMERAWPRMRLDNGIEVTTLCRDPEVRTLYKNDPLVENKVSVKWFCELQRAMNDVHKDVRQFHTPVWILQGDADRIVDPIVTRRWYERLPVADKQFVWVKDGYHEPLQDFGKRELMEKMLDWTNEHLTD